MKRRNLIRNILLFIFAFIFGYTIKREGDNLVLLRMVNGKDGNNVSTVINLENYKSLAVGNDYTESFKAAANEVREGGIIVFPKNKSIELNSSITIKANTIIEGSNVTFRIKGNFRPFIVEGTSKDPIMNVHIRNVNFTFNGTGKNQTAIRFDYAEDCSYENILIENPGLNGIEVSNSKRVHGKNVRVMTPQFFGVLYYLSDFCSDKNFYIYKSQSWAHQFKSSQNCKSFNIVVIEPQTEYGLYMWSGYGDGINAPRENKYCGYINPYVKGTAKSKHLIYINASPDCFIENPLLEQASGGWAPIGVNGTNKVENGLDGTFTTDSSGCRIINPKITYAGGTEAIVISGISGNPIKDCEITGGIIKNAGTRAIYCSYAERIIIHGTKALGGSIGVEASNSIVECAFVSVSDNNQDAYLSVNNSVLKMIHCESYNSMNLGINMDSKSVLIVNGGVIRNSKNSAMIINGNGGSVIGGGLRIIGARRGANSYNSGIRLLGSNVLINNVVFDVGESIKLDSFIKEIGTPSNNKIGKNNIYIGAVPSTVLLLSTSGSKGEDYGTSAPSKGDWGEGWIRWKSNPTAGGKIGWVCIKGGSPGLWKSFGSIDK